MRRQASSVKINAGNLLIAPASLSADAAPPNLPVPSLVEVSAILITSQVIAAVSTSI